MSDCQTDDDSEEVLRQFAEITDTDEAFAHFILQDVNFDLERALAHYYSGDDPEAVYKQFQTENLDNADASSQNTGSEVDEEEGAGGFQNGQPKAKQPPRKRSRPADEPTENAAFPDELTLITWNVDGTDRRNSGDDPEAAQTENLDNADATSKNTGYEDSERGKLETELMTNQIQQMVIRHSADNNGLALDAVQSRQIAQLTQNYLANLLKTGSCKKFSAAVKQKRTLTKRPESPAPSVPAQSELFERMLYIRGKVNGVETFVNVDSAAVGSDISPEFWSRCGEKPFGTATFDSSIVRHFVGAFDTKVDSTGRLCDCQLEFNNWTGTFSFDLLPGTGREGPKNHCTIGLDFIMKKETVLDFEGPSHYFKIEGVKVEFVTAKDAKSILNDGSEEDNNGSNEDDDNSD